MIEEQRRLHVHGFNTKNTSTLRCCLCAAPGHYAISNSLLTIHHIVSLILQSFILGTGMAVCCTRTLNWCSHNIIWQSQQTRILSWSYLMAQRSQQRMSGYTERTLYRKLSWRLRPGKKCILPVCELGALSKSLYNVWQVLAVIRNRLDPPEMVKLQT